MHKPNIMKTLKYAWRFLVRSKSYTVINSVGLSLSLACTIILVRYIHQETQVNTHCIDAENVYIPLRDIDGNVLTYVYTLTSDNTLLEKVLTDLEKIAPVKFEYNEEKKEVLVKMK